MSLARFWQRKHQRTRHSLCIIVRAISNECRDAFMQQWFDTPLLRLCHVRHHDLKHVLEMERPRGMWLCSSCMHRSHKVDEYRRSYNEPH